MCRRIIFLHCFYQSKYQKMLTSLIEFGANVEKIHKKTCLVLLEAEFYKL